MASFEEYGFPASITIGNLHHWNGKAGYEFNGEHGTYLSSGTIFNMPPKNVSDIEVFIHPKNGTGVSTGYPEKLLLLKYLRGELKDSEFNLLLKKEMELS